MSSLECSYCLYDFRVKVNCPAVFPPYIVKIKNI